jgi:tetratricopeptide (TPR) repeat protein
VNQLKKEAKDLWDWISYHFEFKTDDAEQSANLRYNKKPQTRVFISYVPEDYAIAKKLYDDLKTAGFQPWLDREDLLLGQNWKIAISEAIKESDYFLALLSSHSLGKRSYVQKELKIALDILGEFPSDEIYIIPVRVEPCEPLDERLQDIHWIELYPSYETGFKQILKLIHPAQRKRTIDNRAFFPIDKKNQFEIADRIQRLAERYDTIKLDDALRERTIKEKIDIQKLLGQEYMALKDYGKAEQCFRLALALAQHSDKLEYEKDEISFLLNQVYYQPQKTD